MAIPAIGGSGLDLGAFARANSLSVSGGGKYTGDALSGALGGLLAQGEEGADPALAADGIGAGGLGLQAAEMALAGAGRAPKAAPGASFEDALLKAIDGVNSDQVRTSNLIERMVSAPDSVNAHDVTIAMAEANLSLNLARTILDRIVRGWKEVINTR